jgi:two-component system, NarL family, nitrate/nitrite response regulator NarL
MSQQQIARVAIVHRDGLYRDSLRYALTQVEHISIVYSLSRLEDLRPDAMMTCRPDLAIFEYGLCCCHESSNLKRMSRFTMGVKAIAVGVPDKDEDILACIEGLGVAGYVSLDASLEDLIQNIRAVIKGGTLCSARVASLMFNRVLALTRQVKGSEVQGVRSLTRREAEIARLIDDGLSNKEIAARLRIELSTVKNHVHNILDKLQLRDRYSAVRYIKEHAIPSGPF